MEKTLLAIDCGTQSLRALLFTTKGELLGKVQMVYAPYYSQKPGWAEQDAETYWQAACQACRQLKEKNSDAFAAVAGVGVTTLRATMVNVDQQGRPLRPIITWLDQRKAKPVYTPNGPMKLILRAIGMEEALQKTQTDGKCNWIKQFEPEIWQQTHKYLQVSGYLNHCLTGRFRDSVASQIGHIPFNYKKMAWASKRSLPCTLFPIEHEKLPELVPPGSTLGQVTPEAASQTGIPQGIPVIACGSDKGCETIGMGVVDTRMASLSFGTTATVQTTSAKYFESQTFMPPYPATMPGHYNPEIEIFRGYWMITWFKNEFCHKEVQEAETRGIVPEQVMDNLLSNAPAGSMGLTVQPYWGPGLKEPSAKGAMIGFGDVHTKAHVYRAVIEGLGYGLLDGLLKMQKKGKFNVERLAVSGGASQSDQICQISADIFNLPLVRGKTFETSGLGAAIITAVGLGIYPDFDKAIQRMVTYDATFEPKAQHVAIYQQLFHKVYKKMYPALESLYATIRDITGYPEK